MYVGQIKKGCCTRHQQQPEVLSSDESAFYHFMHQNFALFRPNETEAGLKDADHEDIGVLHRLQIYIYIYDTIYTRYALMDRPFALYFLLAYFGSTAAAASLTVEFGSFDHQICESTDSAYFGPLIRFYIKI